MLGTHLTCGFVFWSVWGRCTAAIERHSAVWRFNLDTPSGSEAFVGNTTTVRVVNQGASNKMNDPKGKTNKKWHPGEREVKTAVRLEPCRY